MVVCLLGVLAVGVEMRVTGRARPPAVARESAIAAFEAARRGPAPRWAPEPLRAAEGALRDALVAWSRQESRLLPLRDFRPVAGLFVAAEALARDAGRLGEEGRAEGRAAAEGAVRDAHAVEAHAQALVAATTLPRHERAHLLRARLLVREAEAFLREGEIDSARERAERSRVEMGEALGPALEAAERYTSRDQVATWRRWIDETRAWSRTTGEVAILVLKEKNFLVLLARGKPVRTYDAEIGANALGVKQWQGDRATPEGRYRVVAKKDHGRSRYYRALLLDYPNASDRKRFAAAQKRGEIPPGARIGGLIEIHGEGGRGQNWTEGCVALSTRDIDDLYRRVRIGTRVTIVGGDGRDGAFSDLLARVGGEAEGARP
ncbi:MAG TPA: L,D-transpeptidase [Vicinamibacteria bacterium]|nr:L,D-transpeptidase [Vicinamibacteria bacterium]